MKGFNRLFFWMDLFLLDAVLVVTICSAWNSDAFYFRLAIGIAGFFIVNSLFFCLRKWKRKGPGFLAPLVFFALLVWLHQIQMPLFVYVFALDNSPRVISLMSRLGISLDMKNPDSPNGEYPISGAVRLGNVESVKALYAGGANINVLDSNGNSLNDLCKNWNHIEICTFLKSVNPDFSVRESEKKQ